MSENSSKTNRKWMFVMAAIALMAISSCFTAAGVMIGMNYAPQPENQMAPLMLKADSAARGKQISMATGQIDENVEGLYILDHLT